jgi:phenylacetate-CoA ligase
MPEFLSLYHMLPYPFKVLAASTRGYQLRWWRYGSDTERLIADALDRERWTKEEWQAWRQERLARTLHRSATRVPFYQAYWQKQRRHGDQRSWEALENWPILSKEEVRSNPRAFIASDREVRRLFVDHTGGTTGQPTLIYESRDTVKQWFAIFEARLRLWHHVSSKDRWGIFGGQKVISLTQKEPPYWVQNWGLNQVYFSIFHISARTAREYVNALQKFGPTHLIVYPSSLSVLAGYVLEQNLQPPPLQVIFSNSELLFGHQKELIEKAFRCPVVDTYGMAELLSGASQCHASVMHYWPEMGFLEVQNQQTGEIGNREASAGEYIFTSLLNQDMPLIRYKNGDSGSLPHWDVDCDCKRKLPRFGEVQGRSNDLILTPDGRKLYLLDSLFNGLPLVEAQLIQEAINRIVVRLVPEKSYRSEVHSPAVTERLRGYLGDVQVQVVQVERIPRDENGKFRPYVSLLNNKL